MEGPYAKGNKTAAFLVRMSLERWASRCLRADNTSVIVAYFDPPGTQPDLTREGSTASTASTLLTSDLAGNTSLNDDIELDPSFYDADEGIRVFQSVHKKHKKRKHGIKGNQGTEVNRVARPWSLGKPHCLLKKEPRCSHGARLSSCPLKHNVSVDPISIRVITGRPDRFVSASTTDLLAEKTGRLDQQLDSDAAQPQQKCIAPPERSPEVKTDDASCAGHGVRQVASNITNSSHCLSISDSSDTCVSECKLGQTLRQKSPLKGVSQGAAPALVAAMWPSSMAMSADSRGGCKQKAFRRCRSKKRGTKKAGGSENEDKSHGSKAGKRKHSPGGSRPLKRRRMIAAVKTRLLKTVIHRTRLHSKTALRRS